MVGKLVGIARWFAGFAREMDPGVAVGRLRRETRVVRADRQER